MEKANNGSEPHQVFTDEPRHPFGAGTGTERIRSDEQTQKLSGWKLSCSAEMFTRNSTDDLSRAHQENTFGYKVLMFQSDFNGLVSTIFRHFQKVVMLTWDVVILGQQRYDLAARVKCPLCPENTKMVSTALNAAAYFPRG